MTGRQNLMSGRVRLDSWKEIARYCGRDVRTVIRWEQTRGLPVHRVPGGTRPAVFAYPEELQDWLTRGGASESAAPNGKPPGEGGASREPLSDRETPAAGRAQGSSGGAPSRSLGRSMVAAAAVGAVLASLAAAWTLTRSARSDSRSGRVSADATDHGSRRLVADATPVQPGPRSARPGRSSVIRPSRSTGRPLTSTCATPVE